MHKILNTHLIYRKCKNHQCVAFEKICDNEKSCFDGSDEICGENHAIHPFFQNSSEIIFCCTIIKKKMLYYFRL